MLLETKTDRRNCRSRGIRKTWPGEDSCWAVGALRSDQHSGEPAFCNWYSCIMYSNPAGQEEYKNGTINSLQVMRFKGFGRLHVHIYYQMSVVCLRGNWPMLWYRELFLVSNTHGRHRYIVLNSFVQGFVILSMLSSCWIGGAKTSHM